MCQSCTVGWRSLYALLTHDAGAVALGHLEVIGRGPTRPRKTFLGSPGGRGSWIRPYQALSNAPRLHHRMEIAAHTFGSWGRAQAAPGHLRFTGPGPSGPRGTFLGIFWWWGHWMGHYQAPSDVPRLPCRMKIAVPTFHLLEVFETMSQNKSCSCKLIQSLLL